MIKNFDKIVAAVKAGKHPRAVCEDIGICKKGDDAVDDKALAQTDEALVKPLAVLSTDGKSCIFCETFTTLLEIYIEEKPDQIDEIREYADMVCNMLGDDDSCHTYISKLDTIVDDLKSGKAVRAICKDLQLCDTAVQQPSVAPDFAALNATLFDAISTTVYIDDCFFCKEVTSLMEVAVAQDPDQIEQIREIADAICGFLPASNKVIIAWVDDVL